MLGAGASAGAALLAVHAALAAPRLGGPLGVVGGVAVLLLAAALALRAPGLIAPALVVLGAEYGGMFVLQDATVDVRAPLYGAAFLVVAELAFASVELRAGTPEQGLLPRRAALLAALAAGGIVVGTIVLAAASVPLNGGLALQAAGVAAAVALLILLGRLALRTP